LIEFRAAPFFRTGIEHRARRCIANFGSITKRAKIHVIYYLNGREKADERQMLMNLAARNGGAFHKVEAPGRTY
jgi:hypothetical protein